MSWLQKIDLLDMKLKHVLATVVLIWLFALGVTRRAEQSNGSSSDVVSRFQNHRKPQKILFENAIKAKPKINVKKTPVKNKEQMKKRYTINEEVAEVVSLHKDSGNPHLLITFTNAAEAKSMKVLKSCLTTQKFLSHYLSVFPLQSKRAGNEKGLVTACGDH